MIGNVVVALVTSSSIIALVAIEPALHTYLNRGAMITVYAKIIPNPVYVLYYYTFFAFMLTWMREIVKDMEDYKGDSIEGCLTMPIKWGLQKTQTFSILLGVITLIPLVMAIVFLKGHWLLSIYILAAVIVPLIMWLKNFPKQATSLHYHKASSNLKWIMVAGLGSLLLYYFTFNV